MKSAGRKIFKNLASNSSNIERKEYKWEHYPGGKKKNVWQIPGNPGQSLIQFCSCQVSHTHKKSQLSNNFRRLRQEKVLKLSLSHLPKGMETVLQMEASQQRSGCHPTGGHPPPHTHSQQSKKRCICCRQEKMEQFVYEGKFF